MARNNLVTCGYITAWYVTNISVVLLNKIIVQDSFRYPLCLTLIHMIGCWIFTSSACLTGFVEPQEPASRAQHISLFWLSQTFTASIVTGIWAFKYIPVSFDQAIGATTPAFTALLAVIIVQRAETVCTYLTLIPVVAGMVIAARGEPSFQMIGFLLSLTSTVARGLKAVLQQVLMSEGDTRLDSLNTLRLMSPFACLVLLPCSLVFEGYEPLMKLSGMMVDTDRTQSSFYLGLLANTGCAVLVNLFSFLVTKHTSALTVQVLGNLKGVVLAMISIMIFKNPITIQGVVGFGITMVGTALYSWSKAQPVRESEDDAIRRSCSSSCLLSNLMVVPALHKKKVTSYAV